MNRKPKSNRKYPFSDIGVDAYMDFPALSRAKIRSALAKYSKRVSRKFVSRVIDTGENKTLRVWRVK